MNEQERDQIFIRFLKHSRKRDSRFLFLHKLCFSIIENRDLRNYKNFDLSKARNSSKASLRSHTGLRRNHSSSILVGGPLVVTAPPTRTSDPNLLHHEFGHHEVFSPAHFLFEMQAASILMPALLLNNIRVFLLNLSCKALNSYQ